jgi:ABC-type polysaccharide/polyol phosphate transport system ATPase subunit
VSERPVAIEARGLSKSFSMPVPRESHSLLSRLRHPREANRERHFKVLDDISFDIEQGEFFGIVGRNGSGKSTLLKLLASVYRPDTGTIRMAGRLAPFLELGVGFNPQLPAYENVILNGVMMGLTPKQARARYEQVIDFAGLEQYTELRLKNYSSGMKVRLAFAMLTQVDADILLMDEVLAVGDTEFQQKCDATFQRMKAAGKTIVLVTHAMTSVTAYCERAMLIHEGRIDTLGDPLEVANRYIEVNTRAAAERGDIDDDSFGAHWARAISDPAVRIVDAAVVGPDGRPTESLSGGAPIEIEAELEIVRPVRSPGFRLRFDNMQGQILVMGGPEDLELAPERIRAGERVKLRARIDNRFGSGRYVIACSAVHDAGGERPVPASPLLTMPLTIEGSDRPALLDFETEVEVLDPAAPRGGAPG